MANKRANSDGLHEEEKRREERRKEEKTEGVEDGDEGGLSKDGWIVSSAHKPPKLPPEHKQQPL